VPGEPAVIAVASGKGGVGKSTVSLNLAIALARSGVATGVLDADLYGPDIAAMVGLTRRQNAGSVEVWSAGSTKQPAVERFGIKVMSAQFLLGEDQSLSLTQPLANLLLDRLRNGIEWGDLDLLIIDLPPGTADLQQLVARHLGLDGVLVIVTPQDVAHLDAKKALTMYRESGVRILGGVENMAGLVCPCCANEVEVFPPCEPERSIWATGVERLASIPLQPDVARGGEYGTPIVVAEPEGSVSATFGALATTIAGRVLRRGSGRRS
jgi:ATP-binding protein involved in chromosome partitioning